MNLKKITLSTTIFLYTVSCLAQKECSKFKIGKYVLSDPSIKYELVIERTDSMQIERNMKTGTESKYWINWKNDCEYSLKIFNGPKDEMEFYKDRLLFVKIISTTENKYIFEASIQGLDFKVTQTMHKYD